MGAEIPTRCSSQPNERNLIMTDINIQNFIYFLKELEKNITQIDEFLEKESHCLQSIFVLHSTMEKMCQSWLNQLSHRKVELE
jgi:hypothetical protein